MKYNHVVSLRTWTLYLPLHSAIFSSEFSSFSLMLPGCRRAASAISVTCYAVHPKWEEKISHCLYQGEKSCSGKTQDNFSCILSVSTRSCLLLSKGVTLSLLVFDQSYFFSWIRGWVRVPFSWACYCPNTAENIETQKRREGGLVSNSICKNTSLCLNTQSLCSWKGAPF